MAGRCIIYCRVSTQDQAEEGHTSSLEHQEAEGRRVAERLGLSVVQVVRDDCSGQTTNRPGLQEVLQSLAKIDALVVYDWSRLGRNQATIATISQLLKDAGVELRLVVMDVSELDAESALWVRGVGALSSEAEILRFVRRSRAGKLGKARLGKWVHGTPPFGYVLDKSEACGLAVDVQQADVVRSMFALAAEGCSLWEISRRLGIARSSVLRRLRNRCYVGVGTYNRRNRKDGRDVRIPESEWITLTVPPTVEPGLS